MTKRASSCLSLYRYSTAVEAFMSLIGILAACVHGAVFPAFTVFFGKLFDELGTSLVIGGDDAFQEQINNLVLSFMYLAIIVMVSNAAESALLGITAARQASRMKRALLDAVLQYDMAYFDREGCTGRLLKLLSENVNTIQNGLAQHTGNSFQYFSTAAVSFGLAFWQAWDVTLLMMAVVPVAGAVNYSGLRMMEKATKVSEAAYAHANSIALECVANIRTVAAYTMEACAAKQYSTALKIPMQKGIREGLVTGLLQGTATFSVFAAYALAMWYGANRIAQGATTPGTLVTVIALAMLGGSAASQVLRSVIQLKKSRMAASDVFSTIDDTSQSSDTRREKNPVGGMQVIEDCSGAIEFKCVSFSYPSRPDVQVLDNLNMVIQSGKRTAVVGPSGSGKSTIISMILRLYQPTHGQVMLDAVDLRLLCPRWLRSIIGLVSQEPVLLATDIRGNITLGRDCKDDEVIAAAKAANADVFIKNLPDGYSTNVGEMGSQLSGGQKQRIAIARAILHSPKVLLLDEATSALDTGNEKIVQETLDSLVFCQTTVTVAHRLSTIRKADTIMVMKSGRIMEQGTHDSLAQRKDGLYAAMLGSSNGTEAANPSEDECSIRKPHLENAGDDSLHRNGGIKSSGAPAEELAAGNSAVGIKAATPKDSIPPLSPREAESARLWKLSLPELPVGLLGILTSAIVGVVLPLFGFLLGSIVGDLYIPDAELMRSRATFWSYIIVAVGAGAFLAQLASNFCLTYMGQKLIRRVRVLLFKSILRQEIGWFDSHDHTSGHLTQLLANDTAHVRGAVADSFGQISQSVAAIGLALGLAFANGWKLALVVLATMPLLLLIIGVQVALITSLASKASSLYGVANNIAADGIRNPRMVAAFNLQEFYGETFSAALAKPSRKDQRAAIYGGLGLGLLAFVQLGIFSLTFWYGGSLVVAQEITLGELLVVFLSIWMAVFALILGQYVFPDVARARASVAKVFEIIDRSPKVGHAAVATPRGQASLDSSFEGGASLEFNDVHFSYPERPTVAVLRGFKLSVGKGKTLALCGGSGGGKSTIISLLERFYEPTSGSITMDGIDISCLPLQELRNQLGLVSQEPVLFEGSIYSNIAYGRSSIVSEEVIHAAAATASLHDFIMGLPAKYETRVSKTQLSGGQKQRLAIARAIVRDPRVLCLDEATSALDTESEAAVQQMLGHFARGRTSIIVAHRLATIRSADQIAVVGGGKVAEAGSHEELMAKGGIYASMVNLQNSAAD